MRNVHPVDHPLVQHHLSVLRSADTPPERFRAAAARLTTFLMTEATRTVRLRPRSVRTPMGPARSARVADRIGLVPILRAGLGMVDAALELLPEAEVWHLGYYRDEATLQPVAYYNRFPRRRPVSLALVLDPMLATGGSAVATVDILKRWGAVRIKFVGIIAAPEGIQRLTTAHPDVPIHLAAVDERLNEHGYILPGLGDAGDRQFGTG